MEQHSKELVKSILEDGEKVIWEGKADAGKPIVPSNLGYFIANLTVAGLIALFVIVQSILSGSRSGTGVSIMPILAILAVAAVAPGGVIADGYRVRRLCYAATNRRLISVNKENVNYAFYRTIRDAAFMTDSEGKTSLLCGKTALKAQPWKWKDIATRNCGILNDKGDCDAFILYAVNDVDGLKKAFNENLDA